MNINIYSKYKLLITKHSLRLSEENETIYDDSFVEDNFEQGVLIDGGKLLKMIKNQLQDTYLSEFIFYKDELVFKHFNYNTGESDNICYKIKEKQE